MKSSRNNIAYIDGANLYRGINSQNWRLDYKKFSILLREKYKVKEAYLFIGFITKNKELYTKLQEAGFILVFKEVIYDGDGKAKGNCDADLVLRVARDFYENKFEKAIIVSSDGDYASLIKFLYENKKLKIVLSPAIEKKCSILIKKLNVPIAYLNQLKLLILASINEKAPDADKTA